MPRFFAGYKLHFFLYLSQFLGTMTCIRRAVLHIRPLRTPKGVFSSCACPVLNAHEPLGGSWLNGTAPVRNPVFGRIVHAYSCCQSENMSFLCLLKHVIDLACLITSFDTIITPLELLVKNFFLTFQRKTSMIGL